MTQTHQDDQGETPHADSLDADELREMVQDCQSWREQSNLDEARADDVLLQRFIDVGQVLRDSITGKHQQD